jgi:hypothetical protein
MPGVACPGVCDAGGYRPVRRPQCALSVVSHNRASHRAALRCGVACNRHLVVVMVAVRVSRCACCMSVYCVCAVCGVCVLCVGWVCCVLRVGLVWVWRRRLEGMDELLEQFFGAVGEFRAQGHNLLDFEAHSFDRNYTAFNSRVSELETRLQVCVWGVCVGLAWVPASVRRVCVSMRGSCALLQVPSHTHTAPLPSLRQRRCPRMLNRHGAVWCRDV